MPLNKIKGNMYNFISHTWNPLAGECPHTCKYCSTNKLRRYPIINEKYYGPIRLIDKEFKTNLGKNNYIFVCSQNDLFAKEVPNEFIIQILDYCRKFDNQYLFQTKNPEQMLNFYFPIKTKFCVTFESNTDYGLSKAPIIYNRFINSLLIQQNKLMITIEPIIDFDLKKLLYIIKNINPFQVNIGADSGNNKLLEPSKEKIIDLIKGIEKLKIKVFKKDNLRRLLK